MSSEDKQNQAFANHCCCLAELAKVTLWVFAVKYFLFSLLLRLSSKELSCQLTIGKINCQKIMAQSIQNGISLFTKLSKICKIMLMKFTRMVLLLDKNRLKIGIF